MLTIGRVKVAPVMRYLGRVENATVNSIEGRPGLLNAIIRSVRLRGASRRVYPVVWSVVWCGVECGGVVECGVVWCGGVWCVVRCGVVEWCGVECGGV